MIDAKALTHCVTADVSQRFLYLNRGTNIWLWQDAVFVQEINKWRAYVNHHQKSHLKTANNNVKYLSV
jgi:hypothetical protein